MEKVRHGDSFSIFVTITMSYFKAETCSLQPKKQLNLPHQEIGFGML